MSSARDRNHAGMEGRGGRSEDGRTKQGEEQEVSEVVGLELEFVAVGGDDVRGVHHGGVVDEDVELVVGAVVEKLGGTGSNAGEACVVHVEEMDAASGDCVGADCFSGFGNVASCTVDGRACGGKSADCLDTHAGGYTGDEDNFVWPGIGEIFVYDDLPAGDAGIAGTIEDFPTVAASVAAGQLKESVRNKRHDAMGDENIERGLCPERKRR